MTAAVGIMGGICSGKSTVAQMLAERGFTVIDADTIAHDMLEKPDVKQSLRAVFGTEIVDSNGQIDNSALAEVAFANPESAQKLNAIMHPPVIQEIDQRIQNAKSPVILDAALLVEKGLHRHYCNVLVFVDTPLEERQKRARATRNWDAAEVSRRERLQTSLDRKKSIADIVINNDSTIEELEEQIPQLQNDIMNMLPDS